MKLGPLSSDSTQHVLKSFALGMSHLEEKTRLEYWLALASVEGLGGVRIKRLLTRFGSVSSIFKAELLEIARLPSFNPVLASRILTVAGNFPTLRERLKALNSQNVEVLCPEDAMYPRQLKSLSDAPAILCRVGKLSEVSERCVAIVGCKQPTIEGIQVTLGLAIRLVEAGFTIVSGLASGVDTNAHYGALGVDGATIGVLSADFSSIYPPENRELAEKIYETGCLFSEHPFPTAPSPGNLIQRNRIISGLSMATIVIESHKTGGAMHTARYAQLQDRPVLACRWETHHELSEGPLALIKTGAFSFLPTELDKVVDALMHPEHIERHTIGTSSKQMALFEPEN